MYICIFVHHELLLRKTVVPRAPVKGRKKKKRLDESESDWSDESRESPVPSKPGYLKP